MNKPHLVIRGGRVLQFNGRERAADWQKAFGHLHGGSRSPFSTDPKTFREWIERNRALHSGLYAKRVRHVAAASSGPIEAMTEQWVSRMLEAWRTRDPLFGRGGRGPCAK